MKSFKEKMYNYEVAPPPGTWQTILTTLKQADYGNVHYLQKRNKGFYFSLAAASVILVALSIIVQLTSPGAETNRMIALRDIKKDQVAPVNKITVPQSDNITALADEKQTTNNPGAEMPAKKYVTIAGPGGQPVRISSKVASLIVSSDGQNPPDPKWNDKVKRWKDIMKANILAPTTTNFLDIVDLTYALNSR